MGRIERIFILVILLFISVTYFELYKKLVCHDVIKPMEDRIKESTDHLEGKEKLQPKQLSFLISDDKLIQIHFATRIIYNRVPKCGSTSLRSLITKLAKWNHFHSRSAEFYEPRILGKMEQIELVEQLENLPEPWFYDRHMHFMNFSEFHHQMPVYINLVRDPVDRFVSRYYHVRYVKPRNMTAERHSLTINDCIERGIPECNIFSMKYDTFILIPFFCGYEPLCTYPNENALNKAKQNAVKHYLTGIMENLRNFLELLEYLLPHFFEGIVDFYKDAIPQNVGIKKDILMLHNRKKLQNLMKIEYEFYDFLKGQFFQQLAALKNEKQNIDH